MCSSVLEGWKADYESEALDRKKLLAELGQNAFAESGPVSLQHFHEEAGLRKGS